MRIVKAFGYSQPSLHDLFGSSSVVIRSNFPEDFQLAVRGFDILKALSSVC